MDAVIYTMALLANIEAVGGRQLMSPSEVWIQLVLVGLQLTAQKSVFKFNSSMSNHYQLKVEY